MVGKNRGMRKRAEKLQKVYEKRGLKIVGGMTGRE